MIDAKQVKELQTELEFLYRVASSVHSLEIGELLAEIVRIASQISRSDSCLIYVYDAKKQELVLRASQNPHPELLRKIKMKLGEGITGWVAKEKQPVVIESGANHDSRFKYFRSLPEDKFAAFLSVPIVNKIGIVGVINVQHQLPHKYKAREINLLMAIGKLVGGAIENALLVEETLELKETLEFRKLVERAKGILMKHQKIDEATAYTKIQKESMRSRKSIKEIAETIILAEKLKLGA
ncbi:MAG: hypothetical protein UV61_C0011G0035 [Candidatus Gottesmanbacteria bacterium GW2011_GWB1_43_11]|uniref:ANTAR domain-containing protein n=1 Tax=Candidatus Gottesmanbacteria bacterium GW2011_GWB1_43_11 TaxID=1618446 RepID=A0A0G1CLL2_9BACT|nr:MAG: hypothetical protein UV04_C0033G0005 [Candidatus Gottesmanbacteria bacterium GW2011_GWA2_42_16]KKS82027.1 MAG: ANTAR domain-containing protein with unknown sensor, uroporphyrinogen-III synthase [Candidatus Gottesmanbacteria bacterium GW2011_GWC1_43_10]KKS86387.1 MAG: hypothetical protein UV61_C0011G0035 [Candidatus Gottesmanbacteria bacterium GW2011_GWB1_43_11]OGG09598.1 MAG: hypothetical protein A2699_02780 [Candidatus Gottesmanbacteria bacterium RIFCSPHIGHO2_01_FULL_43_15]OGG27618.1 M